MSTRAHSQLKYEVRVVVVYKEEMPSNASPHEWSPAFDGNSAVIYAVDRNLRLTHTNFAWDQFACENGAPELAGDRIHGICLMDVISEVLRPFYEERYRRVTTEQQEQWHVFECSSPEVYRRIHMRILPLTQGILMINSLVAESGFQQIVSNEPSCYVSESGIVTVCSHCRRVKNLLDKSRWDWVPSFFTHPPAKLSHGLCSVCTIYHYGLTGSR